MNTHVIEQAPEAIPYHPEGDSFDLHASLRRLRHALGRHLLLIVLTAAFTLGVVLLYIKLFPPIYRAEVIVAADSAEDTSRNSYYALWSVFRNQDVKSDPELVASATVAAQVVDELHLTFDDVYHPFLTHLGYLWTESWPGRGYKKVKEWIWPPDPSEYRPTAKEIDRARTIESFREGVKLEPIGNSMVGRLIVRGPNYHVSEYANKLIDVYLAQRRKVALEEAEAAYGSLKIEVDRAAFDLAKLEREKVQFDRANSLSIEFEGDKALIGKWVEVRSGIADLEASLSSAEAGLAVIQQQLRDEPHEVVSTRTIQESKVRTMLQQREFELKSQSLALRERYLPTSPEVMEVDRLLAETRALLAKEPASTEAAQSRVLNPTFQGLRQQEQALLTNIASSRATLVKRKEAFAQLSRRIESLPAMFMAAHELARTRGMLEGRFKMLNERLMMADVSRATALSAPSSLRIVDRASPPMKKSWPDLRMLLPGALAVGLLLGVALALVAEMLNNELTLDRAAARRTMPVYAVIGLRAVPSEGGLPKLEAPPTALRRLRKAS